MTMERVLGFGPEERLVGILSEPTGAHMEADVAVIISNAGIVHRVGPNRTSVILARYLAENGYTTLRYDLPGIGDSQLLLGGAVVEDNVRATKCAMDALQNRSTLRRFILVGLCSGSDHSFRVMALDPRVVGAVLIDPTSAFSTPRHRLNLLLRLARRASVPRVWWRLLTGRYRLATTLVGKRDATSQFGLPRSLSREKHEELWVQSATAFRALVKREAKLLLVTTGHSTSVYSYARQIFDAFREIPALEAMITVAQRPDAAHTFTAEQDRRFLKRLILGWLTTIPAMSRADPQLVPTSDQTKRTPLHETFVFDD